MYTTPPTWGTTRIFIVLLLRDFTHANFAKRSRTVELILSRETTHTRKPVMSSITWFVDNPPVSGYCIRVHRKLYPNVCRMHATGAPARIFVSVNVRNDLIFFAYSFGSTIMTEYREKIMVITNILYCTVYALLFHKNVSIFRERGLSYS